MRCLNLSPLLHRHSLPVTRLVSLPLASKQPLQTIQQPIPHTASYSSASSPPPFDPETYLDSARQKFASQSPTVTFDTLSPTHSRLLTLSLSDYAPALFPRERRSGSALPQGHHLVYFPLPLPPSRLMPDGTDPAHWPGPPFARRMWAGGEVLFKDGWDRDLRLDGREAACVEEVGAPVVKGSPGRESVFVEVNRAYGLRADGKESVVREVRKLVFMREREGMVVESGKIVKASATPDFTFSLRPDATLLFHFSALTYNAHSIHIDSDYARNREGYKGLLVHGPLTLVLMIQALRACLAEVTRPRMLDVTPDATPDTTADTMADTTPDATPDATLDAVLAGRTKPYVKSLSYRNLAPLYANEKMKVCLRRTKPEADRCKWDVWIEGPEGGLAVKGSALTLM